MFGIIIHPHPESVWQTIPKQRGHYSLKISQRFKQIQAAHLAPKWSRCYSTFLCITMPLLVSHLSNALSSLSVIIQVSFWIHEWCVGKSYELPDFISNRIYETFSELPHQTHALLPTEKEYLTIFTILCIFSYLIFRLCGSLKWFTQKND